MCQSNWVNQHFRQPQQRRDRDHFTVILGQTGTASQRMAMAAAFLASLRGPAITTKGHRWSTYGTIGRLAARRVEHAGVSTSSSPFYERHAVGLSDVKETIASWSVFGWACMTAMEMRRRASTTRKMLGWKTMATERNNADWPTQRRFVIRSIPKAVVDQLHVRVAEMRLLDP